MLHVSPKSNLGPRSDRLKALLLPVCSCWAFPQSPWRFVCRTERSGLGAGGQCRLAGQEVFRPNAADIRFDWQAQCFWLPMFNSWSSHKNLISYLSGKTGTLAMLACIPTWQQWLQWPRTGPLQTLPRALSCHHPCGLASGSFLLLAQHPLGDVRVLLPAWTFHMHA